MIHESSKLLNYENDQETTPPRLSWTSNQPTVAGWYLWRSDECSDLPVLCYKEGDKLHLTFIEGFYIGPCEWHHGGRWAGPLAAQPGWPRGACPP